MKFGEWAASGIRELFVDEYDRSSAGLSYVGGIRSGFRGTSGGVISKKLYLN